MISKGAVKLEQACQVIPLNIFFTLIYIFVTLSDCECIFFAIHVCARSIMLLQLYMQTEFDLHEIAAKYLYRVKH